ncbi:uncharacterized protein LOC131658676 [Vicia villosa]|uniref:uncharacterized protein LOC131658676 n=1 Tax=Vicia villosa TaxID=3911 RepID=UPI00273AB8D5|nr:uncharacterized protein LOC131658676 [Vicia villosa]
MAKSKSSGGMGFIGISDFNKSLLGKQYWRLLNGENSLVGRVLKGRRSLDEDCKVAALIDEDLRMWNRDLVFQAFDHDEATQIVSIPLSRSHMMDKRIWHFEKSGEYSVRSAYHLSLQIKDVKAPGPSSPPCKKLWKSIWKAPVHMLRLSNTCSWIVLFLGLLFFSSVMCYRTPVDLDFNDWLLSILSCGDVLSSQIICNIVYKIWLGRNQKLYQAKDSSPIKVAEEALESVMDFNKWNFFKKGEERLRLASDTSNLDVHSIHVDARFSDEGFMTMGCIIKDHNQILSLAACRRENVQVEVAVGKAMAMRWGLSLAKDLNLEKIVIKSDAKVVVDCVNGFSKLVALDSDCGH